MTKDSITIISSLVQLIRMINYSVLNITCGNLLVSKLKLECAKKSQAINFSVFCSYLKIMFFEILSFVIRRQRGMAN